MTGERAAYPSDLSDERWALIEFLGLLRAVIVTAASVSDTLVDNGYQKSVAERGEAVGIDVTVTQKPNGVKGFQPTARWAVERTLSPKRERNPL